jgi:hypothetical protein
MLMQTLLEHQFRVVAVLHTKGVLFLVIFSSRDVHAIVGA